MYPSIWGIFCLALLSTSINVLRTQCWPIQTAWESTISVDNRRAVSRFRRDASVKMRPPFTVTERDKLDTLSSPLDIDPLVWNPSMCLNDSGRPSSTFLWRISTQPPSYLFGTLHVAYVHVWSQIAPEVKEAFSKADRVYFELDLTNDQTLTELRQCQMLPRNTQLTDILPAQLVIRLERYLADFQQHLPQWTHPDRLGYTHILYETMIKDWQQKRPIWLLLLINSLNRGELNDRGVPVLDLYLAQEARRLGKVRGAVEQVEDQCNPLNEVKNNQVAVALELTLNRLESTSRPPVKQTESGGQHETRKPQTLETEAQVQSPPISARENPVNPDNFGIGVSGHSGVTQFSSIPAGNNQNEQTKYQRHTEWFTNPVQQLVQQYNCGDLTSVLSGAPVSPVASVTVSKSVVENSQQQQQKQKQHNRTWQHPGQGLKVEGSEMSNLLPRGNQTAYSHGTSKERGQVISDSSLLLELEGYLNDELIFKRNARMAQKIIDHLNLAEKQQQRAFFALGAAHFMGKRDTVIDHLIRAGYQITPIPRDTTTIEAVADFQSKTVHKFSGTPISRNRRKQEDDKELLSEYDVPEFKPRYVKFENNWIKIEDFKPNTYPNRLHRPSTQVTGPKLDSQNDQTSNDFQHLNAASMTEGIVTDEPSKNVSRNYAMHSSLTKPFIDMIFLFVVYFRILICCI